MSDIQPGYVGFSRSPGLMGKLIRFGEIISGGKGEVNHMFIFSEREGYRWKIIQAQMKGVTNTVYFDELAESSSKVVVVKPPPRVCLPAVVEFAQEQVGIEYGLGTDIGIGIDMVTWQWVPAVRGARTASWICSALGCEALRYGGWLHRWIDIYTVTPQQALDELLADGAEIVVTK